MAFATISTYSDVYCWPALAFSSKVCQLVANFQFPAILFFLSFSLSVTLPLLVSAYLFQSLWRSLTHCFCFTLSLNPKPLTLVSVILHEMRKRFCFCATNKFPCAQQLPLPLPTADCPWPTHVTFYHPATSHPPTHLETRIWYVCGCLWEQGTMGIESDILMFSNQLFKYKFQFYLEQILVLKISFIYSNLILV